MHAPLLALLLLCAVLVLSWGPGSHLEFAHRVYRNRRKVVTPSVAELLREQKSAYFYGNIAADIINFKAWGGHYNHCHRWTIVDEMRRHTTGPAQEAFVLGYLSHLAADTIAHNHYVPYHLARYGRAQGLGHLYWEMRADRFVAEERWELVADLKRDRSLDTLDELVNRAVPKKALSMGTNKLLFNHVLLISERDRWRAGVQRLHEMVRTPLDEEFLEVFRRAAVGRVRLALSPRGYESLLHIDTNGKEAQRVAQERRRQVLTRFRTGARRRAASAEAAAPFLQGLESPPPPPTNGAKPHWGRGNGV